MEIVVQGRVSTCGGIAQIHFAATASFFGVGRLSRWCTRECCGTGVLWRGQVKIERGATRPFCVSGHTLTIIVCPLHLHLLFLLLLRPERVFSFFLIKRMESDGFLIVSLSLLPAVAAPSLAMIWDSVRLFNAFPISNLLPLWGSRPRLSAHRHSLLDGHKS